MIEIEIPKDVRTYESKLVGPLTARQTVCVAIAAPLAILAYNFLDFATGDTRLILSATIAIPILLFGWYKPFGMKLEDFLRAAAVSALLSPKRRLYKTENVYAEKPTINKQSNNKKNDTVHKKSEKFEAFS